MVADWGQEEFDLRLRDRGGERRLFEGEVRSFGDYIVVPLRRCLRRLCFCREFQGPRFRSLVVQIFLVEFVVAIVVVVAEDWDCIARYAVEFVENFAKRYKNANSDFAPQHS